MTTLSPNPAMQDLNLTFQESTLIFPSQKTEKKSIFLSNIDQILNYNIPTAHFFSANSEFPPEIVTKRLKMALEKVLVPYDFMAGRLRLNHEEGRLEIDCNRAGAGFVVATSTYSLHEIGDLVCPNLGFRQLAVQRLEDLATEEDQPLCIFQITTFKCGGFAIGMSVSHVLFDGIAAKTFKDNLASQAFSDEKPFSVTPCLDRHLLAARSPPVVKFPHPEFFKPDLPTSGAPPTFDCKREELQFKVFQLTPNDINLLKRETFRDGTNKSAVTSFSVLAALIWRCKALSSYIEDRESTLLNVVDIRSRVNPPLPSSYCGNAVLVAFATAKCSDIKKVSFSDLTDLVTEGPKRVTDEYAKSVIDWLEINKGLPCGEYMVSSWMRLGFEQVEYPWGKPVHCGPIVSHRKDICWVFPDSNGMINALVSLPADEMERFEFQVREFFEIITKVKEEVKVSPILPQESGNSSVDVIIN
ncbi:hypothetical protein ACJIZ3_025767 [Penstemon smallii]|uniref:Uncharacterized protein n=1 Tax=Penstemon smallii TaxID=265156 RepID=A0ABD3TVJ8_9LAMI